MMNYVSEDVLSLERITITNLLQEIGGSKVRQELLTGLQREHKYISSKFFYNQRGSELYTEITRLPEYYPTRTEKSILRDMAPGLMQRHRDHDILELGPGDPSKISILLDAASSFKGDPLRYLPLDISRSAVEHIAAALVRDFPRVEVEGYALDFMTQFEVLDRSGPSLICFLGSTIGNLEHPRALELLTGIARKMKSGDTLLLGTDLLKSPEILHAAYNDAAGVTELFNLNILNSVNELLRTDFLTADFEHLAFFNAEMERVEMHLVARRDLLITSPFMQAPLRILKGERLHTENSHKYTMKRLSAMAGAAELEVEQVHTDPRSWFALTEFSK